MYSFIEGTVVDSDLTTMTVEASGIGYEIFATASCLATLGTIGNRVRVYTYLAITQDEIRLYGFASKAEKIMFLQLVTVSGVGPKMAVGILGGMTCDKLAAAISTRDSKALSAIKGVGKKTAERIVLELHDKIIGKTDAQEDVSLTGSSSEEAVLALMSLGFGRSEAVFAVARVETKGLQVEDIVLAALKKG